MRAMINDQLKLKNVPDISAKTFCLNHNTGNISEMNHKLDKDSSYNSSDTESLHSEINSQCDLQSLNESFHSEEIIYDENYKPSLIFDILERKLNKKQKFQDSMVHDNKQELIKIDKKVEKETKVKFMVSPIINVNTFSTSKEQFKSIFPLKCDKLNTKTTLNSLKTANATTAYSTSELLNEKEAKLDFFDFRGKLVVRKESRESIESF